MLVAHIVRPWLLNTFSMFGLIPKARELMLDFQAGHPWFSILTRTGVFKGEDNDTSFPADLVSLTKVQKDISKL